MPNSSPNSLVTDSIPSERHYVVADVASQSGRSELLTGARPHHAGARSAGPDHGVVADLDPARVQLQHRGHLGRERPGHPGGDRQRGRGDGLGGRGGRERGRATAISDAVAIAAAAWTRLVGLFMFGVLLRMGPHWPNVDRAGVLGPETGARSDRRTGRVWPVGGCRPGARSTAAAQPDEDAAAAVGGRRLVQPGWVDRVGPHGTAVLGRESGIRVRACRAARSPSRKPRSPHGRRRTSAARRGAQWPRARVGGRSSPSTSPIAVAQAAWEVRARVLRAAPVHGKRVLRSRLCGSTRSSCPSGRGAALWTDEPPGRGREAPPECRCRCGRPRNPGGRGPGKEALDGHGHLRDLGTVRHEHRRERPAARAAATAPCVAPQQWRAQLYLWLGSPEWIRHRWIEQDASCWLLQCECSRSHGRNPSKHRSDSVCENP